MSDDKDNMLLNAYAFNITRSENYNVTIIGNREPRTYNSIINYRTYSSRIND